MDKSFIVSVVQKSIEVKQKILADNDLLSAIQYQGEKMVECLQNGGTIWFCGNGGSAADAQHLAAELSGRFYLNRKAYAAEALHVNTSFMTAVANDFGYDYVYARAIEALGSVGDLLIAISTSGNSKNIVLAVEKAKEMGISVFLWSGQTGGKLATVADSAILVPSGDTPRIQEAHITLGHILCEWIEKEMVSRKEV
ncbi:MAG: SIS domain-containing protein [Saprospiraceae bacterium]|nr:SIS domain-containing protein [Saprospiraceae bacterium]